MGGGTGRKPGKTGRRGVSRQAGEEAAAEEAAGDEAGSEQMMQRQDSTDVRKARVKPQPRRRGKHRRKGDHRNVGAWGARPPNTMTNPHREGGPEGPPNRAHRG